MSSIRLRHNTLLHHNIPRRHSMAASMASVRDIFLHTGQRLHMRRLIQRHNPTTGSNTAGNRLNTATVIKKATQKPRTFTQKTIAG